VDVPGRGLGLGECAGLIEQPTQARVVIAGEVRVALQVDGLPALVPQPFEKRMQAPVVAVVFE
jgi:hypothetical protein